ncbi:serine hydrolase domain-containing protein [Gangjinia marincola]|uniref:Serine hydrolase domain-containing protein n=1 Tax=Gangjinia marincola TaxID=578463 RepID=A0ABP3XQ40_9FLAO
MKKIFQILLLFILLPITGCSEKKNKPNTLKEDQTIDDYSARIDSLIQTKEPHFFNGVILITKDDEVVYKKEYGYSDFETKKPISLDDKFRIWSNSKQITAVLILREVEKGTIDLQKPISEYLPDFDQSWANTVTVHHLLNMSSGITDIDQPLAFEPGTDFYYSNPAYGLLGKIIEKVTNRKFAAMANSLFAQLGMENSYAFEYGHTDAELIDGYWIFEDDFRIATFEEYEYTKESWQEMLPAGGMVSNAYDLSLWDKKLHNDDILENETYKLMTTSDIIDTHHIDSNVKYGYGVNLCENTPIKYIGHRGRRMGFVNFKFYVPEKK